MHKFLNVVGRFLTPLEVKDHISNCHMNRIARAPAAPPLLLHLNPAMAMLSALRAVFVQEETEKAVRRMQPSLNPAPDMALKKAINSGRYGGALDSRHGLKKR